MIVAGSSLIFLLRPFCLCLKSVFLLQGKRQPVCCLGIKAGSSQESTGIISLDTVPS